MRLDRPCIAALCLSLTAVAAAQREKLQVGDEAPGLDIDAWVKGEAVTIETGRVYVVEFWATWCGPCRKSIPHLTKLQKEYGSDGLTIIGISDEEADVVKPFVQRQGENMGYTVAVHGQKSFNGVAILSKHPLEDVHRGLPGDEDDHQARYIQASTSLSFC